LRIASEARQSNKRPRLGEIQIRKEEKGGKPGQFLFTLGRKRRNREHRPCAHGPSELPRTGFFGVEGNWRKGGKASNRAGGRLESSRRAYGEAAARSF